VRATDFSSGEAEFWLDGPGQFLLNPANWVSIGDRKACVSLGIGFDGGRHFRRRAWVEDQLPHSRQGIERLNLVWTDKKTKIKRDLVPIVHLSPVHPTKGKEGVVLKGQRQGCLVTVTRFIQASKVLRLSDGTAEWEESQEHVCWVGYPDCGYS